MKNSNWHYFYEMLAQSPSAGSTRSTSVSPASHLVPKQTWTEDDLIDAYNRGKEAMKEKFISLYHDNLALAKGMSEALVDRVQKECSVKFSSVHLRSDGKHFTALVVIPTQEFLDISTFEKISRIADDFNQYSSQDYSICFLFMPKTTSTNKEAMAADGYFTTMYYGR